MVDPVSALMSRIEGAGSTGPAPDVSAGASAAATAGTAGPSFSEVLEQVANGTVDSLKQAEATSISAMRGQASALEVVEAIKSAEQALQTAVAVRDKAVQAYQEISRMAI